MYVLLSASGTMLILKTTFLCDQDAVLSGYVRGNRSNNRRSRFLTTTQVPLLVPPSVFQRASVSSWSATVNELSAKGVVAPPPHIRTRCLTDLQYLKNGILQCLGGSLARGARMMGANRTAQGCNTKRVPSDPTPAFKTHTQTHTHKRTHTTQQKTKT